MRTLQKMIGKAGEGYTRTQSGDPKFRFSPKPSERNASWNNRLFIAPSR